MRECAMGTRHSRCTGNDTTSSPALCTHILQADLYSQVPSCGHSITTHRAPDPAPPPGSHTHLDRRLRPEGRAQPPRRAHERGRVSMWRFYVDTSAQIPPCRLPLPPSPLEFSQELNQPQTGNQSTSLRKWPTRSRAS